MTPDWVWIIVFAGCGAGMGLITSLVGLPKGRDVWGWLGIYAAMVTAIGLLDVQRPFWTLFLGSLASGFVTGVVQALLLRQYIRNNPWYVPPKRGPGARTAVSFIVFGLLMGLLAGAVAGGIAWSINLL